MAAAEARTIWEGECPLATGPAWLAGAQVLLFCDPEGGRIVSVDPQSGEAGEIATGLQPSFVFPTTEGALVYGTGRDLIRIDADGTPHVEFRIDTRRYNRTALGTVDAFGRIWFGVEDRDGTRPSGGFYRYNDERMVPVTFDQVKPGGAVLTPDARTLFQAVASAGRVDVHEVNRAGALANGRVLVEFEADEGSPMGMAADADGNMWIAMHGAGSLLCLSPFGEKLQTISLPQGEPVDLVFGGEGLATIFVTVAKGEGTSAVLALDAGVTGQPVPAVRLLQGASLGLIEDDDH